MKIKVCGLREPENIAEVAGLRPDYAGFIFYKPSPRYCGDLPAGVISGLPSGVEPVAVTVDMDEDEICAIAGRYGFRTFQLHGHESPELCFALRTRGFKVIKAFGIRSAQSFEDMREYEGAVDCFLLDTACAMKGGSGRKFDWTALDSYNLDTDFMLSGGIGECDAEAVAAISHPRFAGIDLNSRFETLPGHKDTDRLRLFFNAIREI